MAQRKFWWPGNMPAQLVLIQNFLKKISNYQTALDLTSAQVAYAEALCQAFIGAFNAADQCRTSMQAMTNWRDEVFYGEPEGTPVSAAPVFPVVGAVTYTRGVVNQFMKFRDLVVALPGYTDAIGEDLGIVGAELSPRQFDDIAPDLKTSPASGYTVNISGSMQGMDAMRVEYAPKGGNFTTVAFLTNTPAGVQISPVNPNQPEAGHIRAVFIKRNEEVGNFSADYPVTLS